MGGVMTTERPVLGVRELTKSFGGVEALKGVSFEVAPGEVVGLVGDNGAGKSTLVKILSGVQPPSSGWIELGGARQSFERPIDATRAGIATVYQDLSLAMQRSVAANFFLGRELTRDGFLGRRLGVLDRRRMERRTHDSLSQLLTRVPEVTSACRTLSGGQRQGLAIARAITWCERLLILDEPTSALGVEQQHEVLEIIRRAKRTGIGVLFVSHQMSDVVSVCDRAVVLRLGGVAAALEGEELNVDTLVGYITGSLPPRGLVPSEPVVEEGGRD